MIIFTLKEKQLIREAVLHVGDDKELVLWRQWEREHPSERFDPHQAMDDGTEMSDEVARTLIGVLSRYEKLLTQRIDQSFPDEDEAADISIDIAEIHSAAETLRAAANTPH